MRVKIKDRYVSDTYKANTWYNVIEENGDELVIRPPKSQFPHYDERRVTRNMVLVQFEITSLDDIIPFGKYKGSRVGDVNPYYLLYMDNKNIFKLSIGLGVTNPYYVNYKKRRR